jgi:flavorubredoxin
VYPEKYKEAFYGYYRDIFSPFTQNVRFGLEKLKELDFDTVCPSHGPVLTKGGFLDYAMSSYAEWAKDVPVENYIPVFFCSAYGYTKKLARAAVDALNEKGIKTSLFDLNECSIAEAAAEMNSAPAFMIGSPTLNRDAVPPIWQLLASLNVISAQRKTAAVFGSYGWSGEAVPSIIGRLAGAKVKVFGDGLKVNFNPTDADISAMKKFTEEFASAVQK